MSVLTDRLGQAGSRNTGQGRFAGRVDVGDDQDVGLVERAGEPVEQIAGSRVAMGLEGHHDAAPKGALRGIEGCLDLGGMMTIVVDQRDAVDLVDDREPTPHAAERGQRFACVIVERNLELVGDGDDGEAVEHVVGAGHADGELAERFAAPIDIERSGQSAIADGPRRVVGLRGNAIGHVPPR